MYEGGVGKSSSRSGTASSDVGRNDDKLGRLIAGRAERRTEGPGRRGNLGTGSQALNYTKSSALSALMGLVNINKSPSGPRHNDNVLDNLVQTKHDADQDE